MSPFLLFFLLATVITYGLPARAGNTWAMNVSDDKEEDDPDIDDDDDETDFDFLDEQQPSAAAPGCHFTWSFEKLHAVSQDLMFLSMLYKDILYGRSMNEQGSFLNAYLIKTANLFAGGVLADYGPLVEEMFICVEDSELREAAERALGRKVLRGSEQPQRDIIFIKAFLSFCPSGNNLVPVLNDSAESHRRNIAMEIDFSQVLKGLLPSND